MKRTLIIAAVAASLAAPAFAQSHVMTAIDRFNLDAERTSDLISLSGATDGAVVSSRNSSATAAAVAVVNASVDSVSDLIDGDRLTVVSNTPAHGADIFAQLAEEGRFDD